MYNCGSPPHYTTNTDVLVRQNILAKLIMYRPSLDKSWWEYCTVCACICQGFHSFKLWIRNAKFLGMFGAFCFRDRACIVASIYSRLKTKCCVIPLRVIPKQKRGRQLLVSVSSWSFTFTLSSKISVLLNPNHFSPLILARLFFNVHLVSCLSGMVYLTKFYQIQNLPSYVCFDYRRSRVKMVRHCWKEITGPGIWHHLMHSVS